MRPTCLRRADERSDPGFSRQCLKIEQAVFGFSLYVGLSGQNEGSHGFYGGELGRCQKGCANDEMAEAKSHYHYLADTCREG